MFRARLPSALALVAALASPAPVRAAVYVATNPSELQTLTDGLLAGDTLLVAPGNYDLRTWRIRNLTGTPEAWIEIRPESGPVAIRGTDNQNVVNMDNVSHVRLEGFEITYTGSVTGVDGIKLNSGTTSDHVIIRNCHIHHITGVGLNSKATTLSFLDVSDCQIHDTAGTGEGMYLGCHDGSCLVRDSVVRRNQVHHTGGDQGDGIEIKRGSYRNIIEDNVVYETNGYPGITLYRTDRGDVADNNVVRRNAVWRAGEGIFSGAETSIENNLVFDSGYGINVRNYSGWGVSDLVIVHNSVYSCSSTAIRLDDWNVATGRLLFLNNAALQDDPGASAIQAPDGIGPAVVAGNAHHGTSAVAGSTLVRSPAEELVSPSVTPGVIDLYPLAGSMLIDTGSSLAEVPMEDFDRGPRPLGGAPDVGAYEWSGAANPGWRPDTGLKPVVDDAGPYPVPQQAGLGGEAFRLTKRPGGATALAWEARRCRSQNYQLFYGPLAQVASYELAGSVCYLGIGGGVKVDLPAGDLYLMLAGTDGFSVVGSLGLDPQGQERPAPPPGLCAITSQGLNACP